jgi:hypothetical protein
MAKLAMSERTARRSENREKFAGMHSSFDLRRPDLRNLANFFHACSGQRLTAPERGATRRLNHRRIERHRL